MERLPLLNASVITACVLIGCAGVAGSTVLRVPAEYLTLQAGVDAGSVGDTVLVAPGVYAGAGNRDVDFGGKDIALIGEGGSDVTVIDCQQAGRGIYFHSGETRSAVVDGFTIRSGYVPPAVGGGAICCEGASPTLTNLVLQANSASSGGALACVAGSNPDVSWCVMSGNSAHYRHGGALMIQHSAPVVRNCVISSNSAESKGGAVWIDSSVGPGLVDVAMTGNQTPVSSIQNAGGAVYVGGSVVLFSRCTMSDNETRDGGGIFLYRSDGVVLDACVFASNHTTYDGGGAALQTSEGVVFDGCRFVGNNSRYGGGLFCWEASDALLSSCVLSGNEASLDGGAVSCWGSLLHMVACTLVGNSGIRAAGGVDLWFGSSPSIERCLIAFSTHGNAIDCDDSHGTCEPVLDCCDVYGNEGGDWVGCLAEQYALRGNFSQDPLMCGPGASDVSLCANSPCLPGNHPQGTDCAVVGALGAGCDPCGPVAVARTSWGLIKSLYR